MLHKKTVSLIAKGSLPEQVEDKKWGKPYEQELSSCWDGWPFSHNRL